MGTPKLWLLMAAVLSVTRTSGEVVETLRGIETVSVRAELEQDGVANGSSGLTAERHGIESKLVDLGMKLSDDPPRRAT